MLQWQIIAVDVNRHSVTHPFTELSTCGRPKHFALAWPGLYTWICHFWYNQPALKTSSVKYLRAPGHYQGLECGLGAPAPYPVKTASFFTQQIFFDLRLSKLYAPEPGRTPLLVISFRCTAVYAGLKQEGKVGRNADSPAAESQTNPRRLKPSACSRKLPLR